MAIDVTVWPISNFCACTFTNIMCLNSKNSIYLVKHLLNILNIEHVVYYYKIPNQKTGCSIKDKFLKLLK